MAMARLLGGGAFYVLAALTSIGPATTATAQTLPARVLRPTLTEVLVRYASDLTPDDRPGVTLFTSGDIHTRVEATVTSKELVVTLPAEIAEQIDSLGQAVPPGAAFLIIDELTFIGGRVQRNVIAPVPVVFKAELLGDVWNTTALNVDYVPLIHRERSLDPDAWVVELDGRPFPVSYVHPTPPFQDTEPPLREDAISGLTLMIADRIPYGAPASIYFLERRDAEPRLLVSGMTPEAPPGRLENFINNVDIHTGFMFTNSQGTDPTFSLVTRFQRPVLFSAFGERNQIAVGPRAELRTNSSEQDDENSIIVSFPIEFRRFLGPLLLEDTPATPLVNTIIFDVGPTLEAQNNFGNRNLVADGKLTFQFSTLGGRNYTFDARPFVGLETGRHPAAGSSIARLKIGIAGQFRILFAKAHLHEIVFEADYVYRHLYTEEPMSRIDVTSRELIKVTGRQRPTVSQRGHSIRVQPALGAHRVIRQGRVTAALCWR